MGIFREGSHDLVDIPRCQGNSFHIHIDIFHSTYAYVIVYHIHMYCMYYCTYCYVCVHDPFI